MFEYVDSHLLPEGQKYGQGVMKIKLDHPPTTPEDHKEISKTIFATGKYDKVAVVRVLKTIEKGDGADGDDEVIEGVVVD
jgi:hypothetical protein